MQIKVSVKSYSRKKKLDIKIIEIQNEPHKLGELIEETVSAVVKEFKERFDNKDILEVFSKEKLDTMAESGKIAFGDVYGESKVELDKAINDAKQAYLDGLVAVFVDGKLIESLDEKIIITDESIIVFVRLVFLNGRMY